jgi:hypothetical protein
MGLEVLNIVAHLPFDLAWSFASDLNIGLVFTVHHTYYPTQYSKW